MVLPRGGRTAQVAVRRVARSKKTCPGPSSPARLPVGCDAIASHWQRALDAAYHALTAAAGSLPASDVACRHRALAEERREVSESLARLAQTAHIQPVPWLSPVPLTMRMLGLPDGIRAALFDLDGVLTDSGAMHAWAWGEVFDDLLLRLSGKTGWHFIPFDRISDYRAYVEGRPRLDGVHAFLGSRGIRLPEGSWDEPAGADTAHGLSRRKGEAIERGLRRRGADAVAGARRYLEAAGHADHRARSDLSQREHIVDARTGWASRPLSTCESTPTSSGKKSCGHHPPRTCSLLPAVVLVSANTRRSPSPTARPVSLPHMPRDSLSSESAPDLGRSARSIP